MNEKFRKYVLKITKLTVGCESCPINHNNLIDNGFESCYDSWRGLCLKNFLKYFPIYSYKFGHGCLEVKQFMLDSCKRNKLEIE